VDAVVATVTVAPMVAPFRSLTETAQLSAIAKNSAGATVPGVVLVWTSDNASVASVSSTGLATGVANGTTTIRAAIGAVQGSVTVTVEQVGATIELVGGANQGARVGTALDTALTFRVKDALGHGVASAKVDFAATSGGGTATPAQATAGTDGVATTVWTLGTTAGLQELNAVVTAASEVHQVTTALALAGEPQSIRLEGGNGQTELASFRLPAPIQVAVRDQYGNAVPDLPVVFAVSGGGTLDSTDVRTNLAGVASTTWVLGPVHGTQSATASIPDSALAEGVVVQGGPLAITAEAVAFTLIDLTSGTPAVGQSATVSGTGFSIEASEHTVLVDGVAATITAATQQSLTFTMPSFGCVPARARSIQVARGAMTGTLTRTVNPAGLLVLAPGQRVVLSGEGDDCLQLPASAGGDEEYLVGMTATRRLNAEMLVHLLADDGTMVAPLGGSQMAAARSRAPLLRSAVPAGAALISASATSSPTARHRALREWESALFAGKRPRRASARTASLRLRAVRASAVGDVVALRVPDMTTDACNEFTTVNARMLAVGPRVTVATDAALPTDPASTGIIAAALAAFMAQFGDEAYAAATAHFGLPADVDADGRVTILFTPAVIPMGVSAFSSAVDAIVRGTCPASNEGELIYVALAAAPTAQQLSTRLVESAPDLAHELIHVVQQRRLALGGVPLAPWLAEGQAELGAEIVGFVTAGLAARADLGATAVTGDAQALAWFAPRFDRLSSFFGWDGASGRIAGAPERCSLFGFGGIGVPCRDYYAQGAAWSFMRFVTDRVAGAFAGGDRAFLQGLVDLDLATDGGSVLQMLTGSALEDLMVEWAMMLYADGRIGAATSPTLQFPSWDLANVFASFPAAKGLTPPLRGFSAFSDERRVVGGGTVYTRIAASGAHGPLALRARDAEGDALGRDLQTRFWVVRVK
jgi:hypothetical protein